RRPPPPRAGCSNFASTSTSHLLPAACLSEPTLLPPIDQCPAPPTGVLVRPGSGGTSKSSAPARPAGGTGLGCRSADRAGLADRGPPRVPSPDTSAAPRDRTGLDA